MFDNCEDYDFTPTESSKLASLFGSPMLHAGDDGNHSLMYTAPKQPKSESIKTKSKPQTSVLCAKVVTLWKLEDSKYKPLGKHGLAIIGSTVQNAYEIIIYKEKNNIIIRAKLNESFSLLNQDDNFSTFYDNSNENWLLKFDGLVDQQGFSTEITQYGAKVVDNTKNVPHKEGEVNADVEEDVEGKSEQSSSSASQTRADILSRMAKMGQQILPDKIISRKNTSTDLSDSELEEPKPEPKKVLPRKFKRSLQHSSTSSNDMETNDCHQQQQIVGVTSQLMSPSVSAPVMFPQTVSYDSFSFMVAQNAELKMNLSQISTKLDAVLQGVECKPSKSNNEDDATLRTKIKALQIRSENLCSEINCIESNYNELAEKYESLLREKQKEPVRRPEDELVLQKQAVDIERLKRELAAAQESATDYELNVEKCNEEIKSLEKTVEIQVLKLKDFEGFYEANKDNSKLQETIDGLNKYVEILQLKLQDFEDFHNKKEADKKGKLERDHDKFAEFNDLIKKHMNNMYLTLVDDFTPNCDYSAADIQSSIAKNIKAATYKIIQDLKNTCMDKSTIMPE